MADHTFAGEAPFLHFVVLHAEFVLGESQGAARSPLRGDPGGLRPPSAALRAAGAAPLPPRKPAKRGPPPPPADPCKPQALARRAAVLRTALAAGGRLRRRVAAPRSGAGSAGPLPAQTYPTGIPRSIGCNCLPSSAAASAAPVRESSAARLVGFFRGSSCPKGTK